MVGDVAGRSKQSIAAAPYGGQRIGERMKTIETIRIGLVSLAVLVMAGGAVAGTAELQVIHNAADPAAAVVDIYVNEELLLDDFAFRAATPFVSVPAGIELRVGVAPANSSGPQDILVTIPVTLAPQGRYVAVANGVLDPDGFAPNPDGRSIGFTLFAQDRIMTRALPWLVQLRTLHGATDAPSVDIKARTRYGDLSLWNNLAYGDFGAYRTLIAADYELLVTPAGSSAVVASFAADLRGLRGKAAVVLASGFLNPAANQGGAPFALIAVLPDGTVVELPPNDALARVQVIHNAADPAAAAVDVYVNDELLLADFAFRAATPFIDVPAGVELRLGIAPAGSAGPQDVLAEFPVTLARDETYVVMATGVLDPAGFAANPDGRETAFTLAVRSGVSEQGLLRRLKLQAYHGSPDAPTVDVRARLWFANLPLATGLGYGDFAGPLLVWPRNYVLDVTAAGDPNAVVASYRADLRTLAGGAGVLFASGFLGPEDNQDGAAFGLFLALPDGTVIALPVVGGEALAGDDRSAVAAGDMPLLLAVEPNYPNPFNPMTTIAYSLPRDTSVRLQVYNVRGQLVRNLVDGEQSAGRHEIVFDGTGLPSGAYLYRLQAGGEVLTRQMTLLK